MYKVYRVTRTDTVDYDEFDECIVIAQNEEEAFEIADNNYYIFTRENVDITEIRLDESKPVLGSYREG